MLSYTLDLSPQVLSDIDRLRKAGLKTAVKKLDNIFTELRQHPTTGIGKPEQLKGNLSGFWSRHITDKHRVIYKIDEHRLQIAIISAYSHYDDK